MKVEISDPVFVPESHSVKVPMTFTIQLDESGVGIMGSDWVKAKVFDRFAAEQTAEAKRREQDSEEYQQLEAYCASVFATVSTKVKDAIKRFNDELDYLDAMKVVSEGEDRRVLPMKQVAITVGREQYPKSNFTVWVSSTLKAVGYCYTIDGRSSPGETPFRIVKHGFAAYHLERDKDKKHFEPHELIEDPLAEFMYQVLMAIKVPH